MGDKFGFTSAGLESPLESGELADYSAGDHAFTMTPRALNCSAAGSLSVDMGDLTAQAIYVVAGLNPYRVTKIYNSGSTAMTVIGMW